MTGYTGPRYNMSVQFTTTYAGTRLTALGQALSGGTLEFQTSGGVEVATLGLSSSGGTAFASVSSKTGTYGDMTADEDVTGGLIAIAVFKNSSGIEIYRVTNITVIGGGGDVEIPSLAIPAGGYVDMSGTPIEFVES